MNILANAINQISKLYPAQQIKIYNTRAELINGVDFKNSVEIQTIAMVQQLKGSEVKDFTTYVDSFEYFRFWVLNADVKLVASALQNDFTNAKIYYNQKTYNVYYREDWSLNGWVIVDGVCQNVGLELNQSEIENENK